MTRSIVERRERTVAFVDTYADPSIKPRTVEVSLMPPNEWHAKFTGGRWEGTGVYKLSKTSAGTRLDIQFQVERSVKGYLPEDLRLRASEIWDRYVTAMETS
jgi:hypothetical protein